MSLTVIVFATIVSPVPDSEEGRWADLRETGRGGARGGARAGWAAVLADRQAPGTGCGCGHQTCSVATEAADFS